MGIEHPFYPIIFIRGYAGTQSAIESTVGTPYMGFNLGSTKIRQRHDGKIVKHIFESPLLRLMKDYRYQDTYENGAVATRAAARSIWIYRYYEEVSEQLGDGNAENIGHFAKGLGDFIEEIKKAVCQSAEDARKFRIYLVAHSMGGLIARCYLQKVAPGKNPVDKVFTYGTPHNGIEFLGANVPSSLPWQAHTFNRQVIRKFLSIPNSKPTNSLNNKFDAQKVFCMIGTNAKDYTEISKNFMLSMSDGLVLVKNAYTENSHRAYVNRSHSGPFGIVNSEEGYQNLRRFLFGNFKVEIRLCTDEMTLPPALERLKKKNHRIRGPYYIDVETRTRGQPWVLSERKMSQGAAIFQRYEDIVGRAKPTTLFVGFLASSLKSGKNRDISFNTSFRIYIPHFEVDRRFWFDDHYPGAELFSENITVGFVPGESHTKIRYSLARKRGMGNPSKFFSFANENRMTRFEIPLGFHPTVKSKPMPGFRGRLEVRIFPWNISGER